MVEVGRCASKGFLSFLGLLFWACAAILFAISIYVFVTYNNFGNFTESHYTMVPASVLMAVGVFFLIAGCLGCFNLCRDNRCLLLTFGLVLCLLVVLLITAAALVFVYKADIDQVVLNRTEEVYEKYGQPGENNTSDQLDYAQEQLHCCGVEGFKDWSKYKWGKEHKEMVPKSCCLVQDDSKCSGRMIDEHQLYTQGCYSKIETLFLKNLNWIAGSAIGLTLLLILGVICTCVLMCYKRENEQPYYNLNS
jgi:tetraspanin-3